MLAQRARAIDAAFRARRAAGVMLPAANADTMMEGA